MPNATEKKFEYTNILVPAGGKACITLPTDLTKYGIHKFTYTIGYHILGKDWHYETAHPILFWITRKEDIV